MSYATFTRTWWRENPSWPNGLEPHAGRRTYHEEYDTEDEAREACQSFNAEPKTARQERLSFKMEFEEV